MMYELIALMSSAAIAGAVAIALFFGPTLVMKISSTKRRKNFFAVLDAAKKANPKGSHVVFKEIDTAMGKKYYIIVGDLFIDINTSAEFPWSFVHIPVSHYVYKEYTDLKLYLDMNNYSYTVEEKQDGIQ